MGFIKTLAFAAGAAFAVKGLDTRLETIHYAIESKKLPLSFDGLKIVHLSDYHNDAVPGLIEAVRAEKADIIITTGDMSDDKGSYAPAIRLFEQLCAIAPTFAISGNHEIWRTDCNDFVAECEYAGVTFLRDESAVLEAGNDKIIISGAEDPYSRDGEMMRLRVNKSMDKLSIDKNMYNILLFHRANMFDIIRDKGFDLILAGHMHGGQFRLPGGRGLISPKSALGSSSHILLPKYFAGRYDYANSSMIVNRGLGNPMVIPRLFNRPELGIITLKCAK